MEEGPPARRSVREEVNWSFPLSANPRGGDAIVLHYSCLRFRAVSIGFRGFRFRGESRATLRDQCPAAAILLTSS